MRDNNGQGKIYYTIGEVAEITGLQQHVLRFWESKFRQIKPIRLAGGRRYYRRQDLELLEHIKVLKFDQNLTIEGIRHALKARSEPRTPVALAAEAKSLLQRLERLRAGFGPAARPSDR